MKHISADTLVQTSIRNNSVSVASGGTEYHITRNCDLDSSHYVAKVQGYVSPVFHIQKTGHKYRNLI